MKLKVCSLIFFVFSASSAQARVFDINKESFAAYFLATGGGSALGAQAVENETSLPLQYGDGVKYNYSGEFGFVYTKPRGNLRFGFELFKPGQLETQGKQGTQALYSVKGEILGYAPKLALEVNLHGNQVSRSYFSGTVGVASFTMKNDYTLSAAGQAAFPGVSAQHGVEAKGSTTLLAAALGYEALLTDTTTIAVEFGYRQLKIDNLSYTRDVDTFSGSHSSGDTLRDAQGRAPVLDLSGAFISIGFRFYL